MYNNKTYKVSEVIVSSFLVVFSMVMLYFSFHARTFGSSSGSRRMGGPMPMHFPRIFLGALLILSLVLLYRSLKGLARRLGGDEQVAFFEGKAKVTFVIVAAYVILWSVAGFVLSSFIAFFAAAKYLEPERNAIHIFIVSVGVVAASYLLFGKIFMIPLPEPLFQFLR